VSFLYKSFGLFIKSEIEIPELPFFEGDLNNEQVQVKIRWGKIPEFKGDFETNGATFQSSSNKTLIHCDGVAKYLVQNGSEIIIERFKNSDLKDLRVFLLGSSLGALLHQRGIVPLHGSTIKFREKAIIFAGFAGSGKSTIAAQMMLKKYQIMGDDIAPIDLNQESNPIVHPSVLRLKIWSDTFQKIGYQPPPLESIRKSMNKFFLPLNGFFYDHPLLIDRIYFLNYHDKTKPQIKVLRGIDKTDALLTNIYRKIFFKGTKLNEKCFNKVSGIANKVKCRQLLKPVTKFNFEDTIDLIERDLNDG